MSRKHLRSPSVVERDAHTRVITLERRRIALVKELVIVNEAARRATAEFHWHVNRRAAATGSVPDEVLALIFEQVHQMASKTADLFWPAWRTEPVVLSHVCSSWRVVALNCPSLWADIYLCSKQWEDYLNNFLKRSGTRPLSITLNFNCLDGDLDMIMTRVTEAAHRWRRLTIAMGVEMYDVMEHLEHIYVPLLEEFTLHQEYDEDADEPEDREDTHRTIFNGGAPRFRRFNAGGLLPLNFFPPLANLTTLVLEALLRAMEYTEFALFVSSLPSLVHLSVEGDPVGFNSRYPNDAALIFPSLRVLRLSVIGLYTHEEMFPSFWMSAHAPKLETLHLFRCREDLTRSNPLFPAMKKLVLEQSTIPPYMIEHLARIFPAIKHLTVIGFHKSVLGMLSCTQRWPNDMVLSLWAWKDEIVNIAAIQRMLKRRIESGRPIAKLCIVNKPPMFPNFFLRNYVQLEIMEEPMIWPRWSPVDQ